MKRYTEKDIQNQMDKLDSLNRKYGFNELNQYGIINRTQVKHLLSSGWFQEMTNTVSGIIRYDHARGVGKYFLLGIQYHKPTPAGLIGDFHRLTERDVHNVSKMLKEDIALAG